jgi:Spy/CpxP family protein refolding chaperone
MRERLIMWKKLAPLLIVLSVALNIAFISIRAVDAIRNHWGNNGNVCHDKVWCPLHRRLNVTDEQWQEIEPRLADFQKTVQEIRGTVHRSRTEMLDLIAADKPDREALRAKQDEILAGQRRMQDLVIGQLLKEKEILSSEQAKKLMCFLFAQCVGKATGSQGNALDE